MDYKRNSRYFHSNDKNHNAVNTDDQENLTEPQILDRCCETIRKWKDLYGNGDTMLMQGQINIYVDSADVGFRQALEVKLREHGIYGCVLMGSTKRAIRTRVSFSNLMMAYSDFLVCDRCKNLRRELKNARKGEGNIARADGNDHIINAMEYAQAPFYTMLNRWKDFKEH